jgi:squalene-hopene/tetraprenyl-beta-curcumene cyclase
MNSVEQAALALEALLAARAVGITLDGATASTSLSAGDAGRGLDEAIHLALAWLIDRVEQNRHHECSPIGLYFARLWYYEKLYPLTFAASALGRAVQSFVPPALRTAATNQPVTPLHH